MTKTQKVTAIFLFLIILGLQLPFINQFAYPSQSSYSDVTISHFPNLYFLQQSLAGGIVPLWSDSILSGYPFSANPLSGMWYPPLWLALLFHGATGLNVVVLLHLFLGAYGMLVYLREEGLPFEIALVGGVAFELMPKVHAHFAAGHVTMVCAVMWTPWLLWVLRRYKDRQGYYAAILNGVILGLIALVDLRWAAYAGALWAAYNVYLFGSAVWGDWKKNAAQFGKDAAGWFLRASITVVLALGVSAPQLVPLLEYSSISTRSLLTPEDNLSFALPLERLINILFPNIGGYAEFSIYPGAILLLLFICALVDRTIWKKRGFWIAAFVVSGIYAVGDVFVLNRLIVRLPGFSLLRVPSRALFISNMAAIVIVCEALVSIWRKAESEFSASLKKGKILSAVVTVMLAVMLSIGLWMMMGEVPFEMVYGSILLVLAFVIFVLLVQGVLKEQTGIAVLIAFLVLDLGTINHSSTAFWPFEKAAAQGVGAAAYLAEQEGVFRVYSPSYSLPQHTAALYGLELADGIDPLQIRAYSVYMEDMTGVDSPVYSVTIPAFVDGEIASANEDAVPNTELLGKLNVRYVAAEFDISAPGLVPVEQFGETRIYENEKVYPRAWVQTDDVVLPVEVAESQANRISLRASGPGMVVLSEMMYPGWGVKVDGLRKEIEKVDGLFRGVEVAAGDHEVVFYYHPTSVYVGCGIGLAAWGFVGLYFFFSHRKQRSV
jgi:Bacterial membrane protein YfhO